jgi:hypothetical protein
MDEREWLACTEPKQMLESLRGQVSERKARLFACACCRWVMQPGLYERGWRDVEASEQYAERAVLLTPCPETFRVSGIGYFHTDVEVVIIRDIFGNPFRPITFFPAWRTPTVLALATAAYEHRLLPSGHLDLDRLAVLADALEESGCTDAPLLEHLRAGPGPHYRGCFAVDMVLGKT